MNALLQTLRFYWKNSLAVALSAAVTTAVLVGALVVGDSMRGSLKNLALERLGKIDEALLSESFFREQLEADLAAQPSFAANYEAAASAILLRGSASAPDSGRRAAGVQIQGVRESFSALYSDDLDLTRAEEQRFDSVAINQALARELDVEVGDDLLLALARPSDIPRESLMGSTDVSDVVQTLRLTVSQILADRGIGSFGLDPSQGVALNAFLALDGLQRALDQEDRINALFVSRRAGGSVDNSASDEFAEAAPGTPRVAGGFGDSLRQAARVEDFGLELEVKPVLELQDHSESAVEPAQLVAIESREIVLRPAIEQALLEYAAEKDLEIFAISSYLANRTTVVDETAGASDNDQPSISDVRRELPYSTISAVDLTKSEFGEVRWVAGDPGPLTDEQIVINTWAAEDLGAKVGDVLEVEYWEVGQLEELVTRSIQLKLKGIVALEGLAADPTLTPPFPGVHDADDMADWEPTFPVDLSLIADRDEEYWDLYRATPKLFIAPSLGQALWSTRFGSTSSIRFRPSSDLARVEDLEREMRSELPLLLEGAGAGLAALAVKDAALRGAAGATDFGGLFLGFSMFLIVAAALLTALFFRLGVEQRAREIGLRLGLGFAPKTVLRSNLAEGLVLAGAGVLFGLLLAVVYARLMVAALGTRWASALGLEAGAVQFLEVHVQPLTLMLGGFGAFFLVAFTIWRSVKRLEKVPPVALLRGEVRAANAEPPPSGRRRRRSKAFWLFCIALPLALATLVASFLVEESQAAPLFFGAGALVLICGLALVGMLLLRKPGLIDSTGIRGQLSMARASASLFPGRSLLAVTLVAAAAFVIVAVGAYGHQFGEDVLEKDSGAGGFSVMAHSDIPLYHDLSTEEGRFELGFSGSESGPFAERTVFALRQVPGDDVSCLNLYQPEKPALLGVPQSFIERGGFKFQQVMETEDGTGNAWELLNADFGSNVVPAIGDFNSVMWILKSGLGKDVEMENEQGETIHVRIVGLLKKSIFQRELVISEQRLLQHFPSRDGYRSFLFSGKPGDFEHRAEAGGSSDTKADGVSVADEEQEPGLIDVLESRLSRFGFDATGTAEQLEAFQAVENTYLGTFRTLGGLGLLLGTLGLGVVLLRNVLERAAELALLRAIGFRRKFLGGLVVAENALLLIIGLALGTLAALVAVLPHLAGGAASVPWMALLATLAVVLAFGLLASSLASRAAMRVVVLDGLRGEG